MTTSVNAERAANGESVDDSLPWSDIAKGTLLAMVQTQLSHGLSAVVNVPDASDLQFLRRLRHASKQVCFTVLASIVVGGRHFRLFVLAGGPP